MNKKSLSLVLLAVGLTVAACSPEKEEEGFPPVYDFICEVDGKMTERHVGVTDAYVPLLGLEWRITYIEGTKSFYVQKPGETCYLMEIDL